LHPIKIWSCCTEAQKELKITHISNVISKNKTAGGFIWEYLEKYMAEKEKRLDITFLI
jgi:hypothetical protein